MSPPHECWFCRPDRDPAPGGWIHEDERWRVSHVFAGWAPAGTVIVESRRHFLDLSEATDDELAGYAPLVAALQRTVKEVTGAKRVYLWSTQAAHPHSHTWLLPWFEDAPTQGPGYLVGMAEFRPCTAEEAVETAERIRATLG